MSSINRLLAVLSLIWVVSVTAEQASNLCYNGNFDSPNGGLDGWNVNYEWLGNSFYMENHKHVTVGVFQGRKNVLCTDFPLQGRVESKPIPIEQGARYKCTLDVHGGVGMYYFNCYKWEPGVAPHPDPKLCELRRIYKSERAYTFSNGDTTAGKGMSQTGDVIGHKSSGWETVSFELPLKELTTLAYEHYKEVRFATVYLTKYRGGFHVANVRVVKLPGAFKVLPDPKAKAGGSTLPKLPTPKGSKPDSDDDNNE